MAASNESKKDPESTRFLLAEDVRQETGGKFTISGLFTANAVLLTGANAKPGAARISLAALVTLFGGHGEFEVHTAVLSPAGKMLEQNTQTATLERRQALSLVFKWAPFAVAEFGDYKLRVRLDEKPFEFPFYIGTEASWRAST